MSKLSTALSCALLASLVVGCGDEDADTGDGDGTGDGGSSEGWSVTYTGAVSGEIGGTVAVVQAQTLSLESVSLAGEDHDSDESLVATYQYPAADPATGSKTFLTFSMTLADGRTCSQDAMADVVVVADVASGDEDAYDATFQGSVLCDEAQVDVEGWFRN